MEIIKGKTALVTGASKRIGREISLELARAGVNVIIHYNHSVDEAKILCQELINLGVKAWVIKANFDIPLEYETLIERAIDLSNDLEFLINSASTFPVDDLKTLKLESLVSNLQVNAWAPFVLCQKFSEQVSKGKIVNLLDSRITGFDWTHVGYILSKHLLTVLTEMMAIKYAPKILVNAVAPGLILPPPGKPMSYLEERVNPVPLHRHGQPQDIAEAVLYLLGAAFITGNIIYVDGGRHIKELHG